MTKRAAIHTISLTSGALYFLLVVGAPFCAMSSAADHHSGHETTRNASACKWAHSACDITLFTSHESGTTTIHPITALLIAAHKAVSQFDFQNHPGRAPPVFHS